ncbi:MAG: protein phosphatase 2C domain-containing protein [Lentisphaeria bacterium]|nr:protein phosphatase 2C domain-containing protein [Lentisphaeria bacterium]
MDINRAGIVLAGESNTGPTRSHNEDNFLIFTPSGGAAALAVIADGIGGHGKGETASSICCTELFRAARTLDSAAWDETFLRAALDAANARIFARNFAERRVRPMGCTVVAAVFFADRMIVANAGDSRLYEYDPDNSVPLRQHTIDHRPPCAEGRRRSTRNEFSNFVSKSLGTHKRVEPEIKVLPRPPRARYLLCSDGLYSVLPDSMFAGMLGSDISVRGVTGKLMCDALLSGTRDNVTLICAGPPDEER